MGEERALTTLREQAVGGALAIQRKAAIEKSDNAVIEDLSRELDKKAKENADMRRETVERSCEHARDQDPARGEPEAARGCVKSTEEEKVCVHPITRPLNDPRLPQLVMILSE